MLPSSFHRVETRIIKFTYSLLVNGTMPVQIFRKFMNSGRQIVLIVLGHRTTS